MFWCLDIWLLTYANILNYLFIFQYNMFYRWTYIVNVSNVFSSLFFCFCAYRKNPLKFSFNSCLIFLDISLYYLCMSNVRTLIYICIWFYNLFIKPIKSSTYIKTLLKCQHANVFFIYKFLIWFSIMFF